MLNEKKSKIDYAIKHYLCSPIQIERIDTIEKAIDTLDDCGCCLNGAYLIGNTQLGGDVYCILLYNASLYNPSYEQCIERPENPSELKNFLHKVFDPFLYNEDDRVRSVIDVCEVPEFNLFTKTPSNRKMLQLEMILYFDKEYKEGIEKTLDKVSDDTKKSEVTEFCLD
jgi:hypothetical protein